MMQDSKVVLGGLVTETQDEPRKLHWRVGKEKQV